MLHARAEPKARCGVSQGLRGYRRTRAPSRLTQRAARRLSSAGRSQPPKEVGAPCRTRTCDLLVRSGPKGGNRGQRETAALRFSRNSHNSGQHQKAASRYRLSVICQSSIVATAHNGRLSMRCRRKQLEHLRHERLQVCQGVAVGNQHKDRDVECRQRLLVLELSIDGHEYIEFAFGKTEQVAISFTGPTHFWRGAGVVAG